MKKLVLALSFVIVTMLASVPVQAGGSDPLITIKFNKRDVNYDKKLFYVVKRALEIKDSTVFNVVGYAPSQRRDMTYVVADTIADLGVNKRQIRVKSQVAADLEAPYVEVFVK